MYTAVIRVFLLLDTQQLLRTPVSGYFWCIFLLKLVKNIGNGHYISITFFMEVCKMLGLQR